jgi:uncharacterized protein (TIGR03067 family)
MRKYHRLLSFSVMSLCSFMGCAGEHSKVEPGIDVLSGKQQEGDHPDSSNSKPNLAKADKVPVALLGSWRPIGIESDGETVAVPSNVFPNDIFRENHRITFGPSNEAVEIDLCFDETVDPKWIDQTFRGGKIGPWIAKGIYKLEGDILTICYGGPDVARPTEFSTKAGDGRSLQVFKREARAVRED